ncbi:hypothetical protein BHE74_00054145 [Ensete ventricosum]|nr:hypothetical protein BHE74_00054145 [Ensete ventricosum]
MVLTQGKGRRRRRRRRRKRAQSGPAEGVLQAFKKPVHMELKSPSGQEAKGARWGIPFRLLELGRGGGRAGARASCPTPSRDPPPNLPLRPDLLSSTAAVDDDSPPPLASSSPGCSTKVASPLRFIPANYIFWEVCERAHRQMLD